MAENNYLDFDGLREYDTKNKGYIDSKYFCGTQAQWDAAMAAGTIDDSTNGVVYVSVTVNN